MFSTFCKPLPQLKFLFKGSKWLCVCVCVSVGVCVTDCCSPLSGFLWLLHMDEALPPSAHLCMSPCAQEEPKEWRNIHMHACMHQLYRTMLDCLKKLSIWPNKGLNLLFPNKKNSRRKRMASTYLWPWVWPSVMVVTLKCATNVMLAKASPLNPRVLMFCRSSNCRSFDVVCLSQRIGKSSLWQ